MPDYTSFLGLYEPSRNDNLALDTTLAENFKNIDSKLGSSVVDKGGKKHGSLKERLDSDYEDLDAKAGGSAFYPVEVTHHRDSLSGTDYTLTWIKHKDENGNIIKLKRGFAENNPSTSNVKASTAREFAELNKATLAINASTFDSDPYKRRSADFYNGASLSGQPVYSRWELGVLPDNTLKAYPPNTPVQTLRNDNVQQSFAGFCPFIIDGVKTLDDYHIKVSANSYEQHPRNAIAQFANKDIVILTCDGRTSDNAGMTIEHMANILFALGVDFAYNLDGGGSTQTVVRGSLVNRPTDADGYEVRKVPDFIYFAKENFSDRDDNLLKLGKDIGDTKIELDKAKRTLSLMGSSKAKGNLPTYIGANGWDNDRPADLNSITESGFYWGHSSMTANIPNTSASWAVIHFKYGTASDAMQIAFPFSTTSGASYVRRTTSTGWGAWQQM